MKISLSVDHEMVQPRCKQPYSRILTVPLLSPKTALDMGSWELAGTGELETRSRVGLPCAAHAASRVPSQGPAVWGRLVVTAESCCRRGARGGTGRPRGVTAVGVTATWLGSLARGILVAAGETQAVGDLSYRTHPSSSRSPA